MGLAAIQSLVVALVAEVAVVAAQKVWVPVWVVLVAEEQPLLARVPVGVWVVLVLALVSVLVGAALVLARLLPAPAVGAAEQIGSPQAVALRLG